MKRVLSVMTGAMLLAALLSTAALAASPDSCATIKDGGIVDSANNPISLGFDEFGYNYQAHLFVGTYDSVDRVIGDDTGDLADDRLIMKWSDAWLANVDCDLDGKLDRGLVDGVPSGISMGWLTNNVNGDYTDVDGDLQTYTSFDKIVWVGPDAEDLWGDYALWGQYAIIQTVYNDSGTGEHGLSYKIPSPGFGLNDSWTSL